MGKGMRYALAALGGAAAALLVLTVACGGFSDLFRAARFAWVMRLLDMNYVGELDPDEVTDRALTAAVNGLDDWSYYMDAESLAAYEDYQANQYQGIGVTVMKDAEAGGIRVLALEKDGPAQQAGILAGDLILAADGQSMENRTTDDLRAVIQADFGSSVRLTVRRADGTEEDVDVSCQVVYDDPVSGELLRGHVGYIAIENFHTGAGQEALDMIDELLDQGADCLLFDLRDDPGGVVAELIQVLDRLLPEGTILSQTDKAGHEHVLTSDAVCLDVPMAVVVNAESCSAAELFAEVLREYDMATVVGEATTGKSRSQVTYDVPGGGAVHLSHYRYVTHDGVDLWEWGGIVPDVEVSLTQEQASLRATGWLEPEDDPQIQAALDLLDA